MHMLYFNYIIIWYCFVIYVGNYVTFVYLDNCFLQINLNNIDVNRFIYVLLNISSTNKIVCNLNIIS
jgi:hypothetical protein